jgi:hypothetical protein
MRVMAMIGQIVRSPTVGVGRIPPVQQRRDRRDFRVVPRRTAHSFASALGWGAAYGFAWWILGGLILMPIYLGMPAFAPLMMPPMRMMAMGSSLGHLIFGVILGGTFAWLRTGAQHGAPVGA